MDIHNLHSTWREALSVWSILRHFGYLADDIYLVVANFVGKGKALGIELFPNDPFKFTIHIGPLPCEDDRVLQTWNEVIDLFVKEDPTVIDQMVKGSNAFKHKIHMLLSMRNSGLPVPEDVANYRANPKIYEMMKDAGKHLDEYPEVKEMDAMLHREFEGVLANIQRQVN